TGGASLPHGVGGGLIERVGEREREAGVGVGEVGAGCRPAPAGPSASLRLGADATQPPVPAQTLEVLADRVLVQAGGGDDVGGGGGAAGDDFTEDPVPRGRVASHDRRTTICAVRLCCRTRTVFHGLHCNKMMPKPLLQRRRESWATSRSTDRGQRRPT